jgi:hypothetical protein
MAMRVERLISHTAVPVLLLGGLLAPAGVGAQDPEPEPIVPLQFSSSDPGARSMGFGGAFVALADDATAAFSNPAGLVQLVRPEVSIEGRHWSYSTPFTEGGRLEGLPSGFGIDTTVGLRTARSENALTSLSFLSVAYPRGDWSLALFRHELANFEFSGETQGLFGGGTNCCQIRYFDQRATADLKFVSYGLSGAYRIHERFDMGFGVLYHRSSLASSATVFFVDDESVESAVGPNSYLPERSFASQSIFGDDTSWGLIGGFLWRLSDSWRIGGVFRQGPKLALSTEITAGEAVDLGVPPGGVLARAAGPRVEFPWVLGLGFVYRAPDGGLTVSFQWDRIQYSRIIESLGADDRAVDDADELHLGGEYAFLRSTPVIAVRAGVWLDPDHQLRATEDDPFVRALQPPGEDQVHFTLGLGVAVRSFQVDVGVDLADRANAVSVSAIYSF